VYACVCVFEKGCAVESENEKECGRERESGRKNVYLSMKERGRERVKSVSVCMCVCREKGKRVYD
jgi:hypothetical protein